MSRAPKSLDSQKWPFSTTIESGNGQPAVRQMSDERYFTRLAAAFVRGKLPDLDAASDAEAIAAGLTAGLRLHKFKRNTDLPRVRSVLGAIRGIGPENLLDIGSGRGTFLWPLMDAAPWLPVVAVDVDERRCRDLAAVRAGGVGTLAVVRADACALSFDRGSFDIVTLLEVAEHVLTPARAFAGAFHAARRFVIVSVPSKEDDNPEHIHVFEQRSLEQMLIDAGAARVRFDSVLNHRIAIASVRE